MSSLDPHLEALLEIQKNTAPGPKPVFIEEKEEELIKKAGEVPLTLLLGIPTVFSGLLPLLFNYGSEMASIRLAAFVSTFFVTFFALPLMLLVFRSYGIGMGRFAVYAILLASVSYGVGARFGNGVPPYVIVTLALAFGLAPQVVASGWWRVLRVEARWLRRVRPRSKTGPAPAERPGWIHIPQRWAVERRQKLRLPSPPLVALSVVLTCGIAALLWIPGFDGELRGVPLGGDSVAAPPEAPSYAATVSLIPQVNGAKDRYEDAVALRDRDAETLPTFPDHDAFWDAAVQIRRSVLSGNQAVLEAVDSASANSVGALIDSLEAHHDRWTNTVGTLEVQWAAALRVRGDVRGNDALVSVAEASLRQARAAVRAGLESGERSRIVLEKQDSIRIEQVHALEGVVALLRTGRAEQSARLLTMDDQIVGQEAAIFASLNKFTQAELARIVNNVRVIGVWMFGSALLVALFGVWFSTRALRDQKTQISSRTRGLRQREARRKATYVLGCAVLALFTLPLLKPIKAEKLDLSQPFTPFTLPTFYLPAFAGQQLQAPRWGSSTDNRTYRQTFQPGRAAGATATPETGVIPEPYAIEERLDGSVRRALADSVRGPLTEMITQTQTIAKEIRDVRTGVDKMQTRMESLSPHIYQDAGNR